MFHPTFANQAQTTSGTSGSRWFTLAFVLFSLWETYLFGVRVLDFVGIAVLLAWLGPQIALNFRLPAGWQHDAKLSLFLCGYCAVFAALGAASDLVNLKTSLGFALGVLVFTIFYLGATDDRTTIRLLSWLLVINISFLALQSVWFAGTGSVLNLYSLIGREARAMSFMFRPTGLYLEPADYALSVLLLVALRWRIQGRMDRLGYVAVASIVATLSLWGLIASAAFLLVYKPKVMALWLCLAGGAVAFYAYNHADSPYVLRTVGRFATLSEDTSAVDRYAGLLGMSGAETSASGLLLGRGISYEYEQFGANGLAFLLTSSGMIGTVALLFCFALFAERGIRVKTTAILLLLLTAGSPWTYCFWWAWLALFLRRRQVQPEIPGAVTSTASLRAAFP